MGFRLFHVHDSAKLFQMRFCIFGQSGVILLYILSTS